MLKNGRRKAFGTTGTTVRFVWYRLNPRRESEPEALYYVVLLGCILVLTLSACQQPLRTLHLIYLLSKSGREFAQHVASYRQNLRALRGRT